jgi:hypothetical protein
VSENRNYTISDAPTLDMNNSSNTASIYNLKGRLGSPWVIYQAMPLLSTSYEGWIFQQVPLTFRSTLFPEAPVGRRFFELCLSRAVGHEGRTGGGLLDLSQSSACRLVVSEMEGKPQPEGLRDSTTLFKPAPFVLWSYMSGVLNHVHTMSTSFPTNRQVFLFVST